MAKCDVCNAQVASGDMEQLLSSYKVDGIVDLCPTCSSLINAKKGVYLDQVTDLVKAELIRMRGTKPSRWYNAKIKIKLFLYKYIL